MCLDMIFPSANQSLTVLLDFHLRWHLRMWLHHLLLAHDMHSIALCIVPISSINSFSTIPCPHPFQQETKQKKNNHIVASEIGKLFVDLFTAG